jgi:putative addiction module component (TIGR02574 family)
MPPALTPESLAKLTVEEKLRLIEMLWASLAADDASVPIPAWQLEIIRERVAEARAHPGRGMDVNEFLDSLRKPA